MVTYYTRPNLKVTVDATDYIDSESLGVNITGFENGFDQATVFFNDFKTVNRTNVAIAKTISIYTKEYSGAYGSAEFSGVIRFRTEKFDVKNGEVITAICDGAGYGFAETLCNQEYGSQSNNPTLDTLKEILTDATYGLVPKYVNCVLNGPASGYTYTTTAVDDITGTIRYLYFPYKPNSKALCDICNLSQAIKGTNAGPHWIVTPDKKLIVTTVGNHSAAAIAAGYTTYYAGSQANATLTQGSDFLGGSFENQSTQANYILYHSNWLWSGNGDLAENETVSNGDGWENWSANTTLAYNATADYSKIGSKCIELTWNDTTLGDFGYGNTGTGAYTEFYHLDLTKAGGKYNIPTFNFWAKRNAAFTLGASPDWLGIQFHSSWSGIDEYFVIYVDLTLLVPNDDEWYFIEFPIGPYNYLPALGNGFTKFIGTAGADWSDIINITFECNIRPNTSKFAVDGVCCAGWVLRSAANSTIFASDGVIKTRIINDPFGKDDTLNADDDSGTIAQLAYAELLRAQTTPKIGDISVPYLPGLRAGQLVHIHARPNSAGVMQINSDFRVTQYTHQLNSKEWSTKLTLTDDVKNSQSRASFESINEVRKNIRPEYQDKQATGIKMRDIDITQTILGKDYP